MSGQSRRCGEMQRRLSAFASLASRSRLTLRGVAQAWASRSAAGRRVRLRDPGGRGGNARAARADLHPRFPSLGEFHCELRPSAISRSWHRRSAYERLRAQLFWRRRAGPPRRPGKRQPACLPLLRIVAMSAHRLNRVWIPRSRMSRPASIEPAPFAAALVLTCSQRTRRRSTRTTRRGQAAFRAAARWRHLRGRPVGVAPPPSPTVVVRGQMH